MLYTHDPIYNLQVITRFVFRGMGPATPARYPLAASGPTPGRD
jgi:hypothetical protein